MTFEEEISNLVNKYSKDNESNTPDFILAEYISDCLKAYVDCMRRRDHWKEDGLEKL